MNLIDLAKLYFERFSNKDIEALSEMFADDVSLKDWSDSVKGKKEVLNVIKDIYELVSNAIAISVCNILANETMVMAEIEIELNGDIIEVVDVIEFKDDQITAIRAYLRGDRDT